LGFPEDAIPLNPGGGVLHGFGSKTAAVDAAVDFAVEQSRGFEDAQVLGNGGQRDVEGSGKFGDGSFAAGQPRENGAPCGIGKRPERGIERAIVAGSGIFNHMV
jgi:hypothetical protein